MSDWKKEVIEGENHYVLGEIRLEPVIGHSYWKWFMDAPGESRTFHTLKKGKEYVAKHQEAQ